MKYWLGGSYFVLKSTPRVPGDIPLMYIGYKYNYKNVLGFIATQGSGSNETGDPYLSSSSDIYSNVSVLPIVRPHLLYMYLNDCNGIEN